MFIQEFITPAMACSGISIGSYARKGNILLCESDYVDIERLLIEFDDEETAQHFERALMDDVACVIIDEDTSLDAAPEDLRDEFLLCEAAGNKNRLEEILDELWEDYGIKPYNTEPRETSGIKRIAVMHDDGVSAYGFEGIPAPLRAIPFVHGATVSGRRAPFPPRRPPPSQFWYRRSLVKVLTPFLPFPRNRGVR